MCLCLCAVMAMLSRVLSRVKSALLHFNAERLLQYYSVKYFTSLRSVYIDIVMDENNSNMEVNTSLPSNEVANSNEQLSGDSEIFANDSNSIASEDAMSIIIDETIPSSARSQRSRSRPSQSSFHSLRETDYENVEYEMVPGHRQNSKLLYADEQFYMFNTRSPLGEGYMCTHSNCNVRVYKVDGDQCIRLINSPTHTHERQTDEYRKLSCLNEMKRRCTELKYMLTGQRVTARDIFNAVMAE